MFVLIISVIFNKMVLVYKICCLLCLMIGVIVVFGLFMFKMLISCELFIIGVVIYIIEFLGLVGFCNVLCVLYWLCNVS